MIGIGLISLLGPQPKLESAVLFGTSHKPTKRYQLILS